MVTFQVGNITQTADDLTSARSLAYAAWLDSFRTPSKPDQFEPPDKLPGLEEFRAIAQQELIRRRGDARRIHITAAFGQQQVYADKLRQACDYQNDPEPVERSYPALYGEEATARGFSPAEMATLILTRAEEWCRASDIIEGYYVAAKSSLEAAKSHADILAILILVSL